MVAIATIVAIATMVTIATTGSMGQRWRRCPRRRRQGSDDGVDFEDDSDRAHDDDSDGE